VRFEGMGVGLVVLAILIAALIYALLITAFSALGRSVPMLPARVAYLVPVLCIIGLGVAGYLTYVEARQVTAICGPVGDCNTVQSSPYATLFGLLPVGLLGALGYLAILCAWAAGWFAKGRLSNVSALAVFVFALFGVLFSMYLTYLELAVILAVCMWCLTSAVIMAVLLLLASGPVAVWLAPVQEQGA
jgi:uncharacterized membrane protein